MYITIVNHLKGIQHETSTAMWWTLPLTWAPLLASIQSWTWVNEKPLPGLQVRGPLFPGCDWVNPSASLNRPQSHPPLHLKHQQPLLHKNSIKRTLPVCGDTYPWFFLLHVLLHWLHLSFTPSSLCSQITTLFFYKHHVKTVCGSISTWAVSVHCFGESLRHNSYQDKSQGSFLPSSILFLPLPSWTAELARFNHQLVAHMSLVGGRVGGRGSSIFSRCVGPLLPDICESVWELIRWQVL